MVSTLVIYNGVLFFSVFFLWLSCNSREGVIRKVFFYVSFLIVFIPAAIRYYIAEDYFAYVSIFERISSGIALEVEPGFYFIVKLIQAFDGDVQWLFASTSFLIYYFLFKTYKLSTNSWLLHLSFLMLFYLETYSVVRASIAICIVMYAASVFIKKENIVKPLLLVIVASLFHKSALLTLPIFLIGGNRFISLFNKYNLNYFILFLLVLFLFHREEVVNSVISSGLVGLFGYNIYLDSDIYMQAVEFETGIGFYIKLFLLLLPLFFYKNLNLSERERFIFSSFVYCCAFTFIMSSVYFIFMRVNYVYFAGFFYSFVLIYSIRNLFISRAILCVVIFFYIVLFELFIINNTSNKCASTRVSPYVTIFNKGADNSIKLVYKDCIDIYGEDE